MTWIIFFVSTTLAAWTQTKQTQEQNDPRFMLTAVASSLTHMKFITIGRIVQTNNREIKMQINSRLIVQQSTLMHCTTLTISTLIRSRHKKFSLRKFPAIMNGNSVIFVTLENFVKVKQNARWESEKMAIWNVVEVESKCMSEQVTWSNLDGLLKLNFICIHGQCLLST